MTNKITDYHHKVVSFWGHCPQTPTGASPLDPTGGDFRPPDPLNFCSSRKKVLATPLIRTSKVVLFYIS